MNVKEFMESPEKHINEMGLSEDGYRFIKLKELANLLSGFKVELKQVKKEKADVARQFKTVAVATPEHAQLIEKMASISDALKSIEEEYKISERQLQELLTEGPSIPAVVSPPLVFIAPESHYLHPFSIRELASAEEKQWYEFLMNQDCTAYHQGSWADAIQQSFSHPTRIWAAFSGDGRILGGIPLTFFNSRLFGRFAVSLPYLNYGGVVTPWMNIARALIEQMKSVCQSENLSHIEVRMMQADLGENVSTKKASMILSLPKTCEQLDQQLGAKVRAQYKKAESFKPIIAFGKMELLNDFYEVFARNMRDLGTPVYSRKWFANILERKEIDAHLTVVYVNNRAVSCGFLVGNRKMLEIPWASTLKEANSMNINMWMYRQILGFAVEHGYRFFDFGRSTQEAGTYKFKKQWGSQPYTHYWYYLFQEGGAMPQLNPDNPKFKLVIAVWQRLPVWLTKLIGPRIVCHLP